MFEANSKKIDFNKDNEIIRKSVNLDENLDLFILISHKNKNSWSLILNKILDSVIDKIHIKNTYKDFSNALESINSIVKNISLSLDDTEKEDELDIIIAILNKNNLLFSTIWNASCYLINRNREIVEITEKNENKKEFTFISDWLLNDEEIVIMWTKRILNYLSNSDIIDWLNTNNIDWFNTNIENILLSELIDSNIWIYSFRFSFFENKDVTKIDKIKYKIFHLFDNFFAKNFIAIISVLRDKIIKKSKKIKHVLFILTIFLCLFWIYYIISWVVSKTTVEQEKLNSKTELKKAKEYLISASQNIDNSTIFNENIKKAEKIAISIRDKKMYINDVNKILDDISVYKKSFNHVEIFDESENVIFKDVDNYKWAIKVLEMWKKYYIVTKKSIIWPVILWKWWSRNDFDKLWTDDFFIDATVTWSRIILLTNLWKIVSYTKSWYFSYEDVKSQKSWEEMSWIEAFDENIYAISKDRKQIYKHKLWWSSYLEKEDFLSREDSNSIWQILNISIDGWVFIIKNDLSMVKFFKSPYRIEKLTINKLPENYNLEKVWEQVSMTTRSDLNYIYMFLNNKVWVFRPNTTKVKSTKSLDYIWQIEWKNYKILDFDVWHDWELTIVNETWLYKMNFDISDNRIIMK